MYANAQRQADVLRGIVAQSALELDATAAPPPLDDDDELMELAAMDPAGIARHDGGDDNDDELEALMRMPVAEAILAPDDELEAMAAVHPADDAAGVQGAAQGAVESVRGDQPAGMHVLRDEDMQELAGQAEAEALGDLKEALGDEADIEHPASQTQDAGEPSMQGGPEMDELEALLDMPPGGIM